MRDLAFPCDWSVRFGLARCDCLVLWSCVVLFVQQLQPPGIVQCLSFNLVAVHATLPGIAESAHRYACCVFNCYYVLHLGRKSLWLTPSAAACPSIFFHIISGASTHVFGIQVLYFAVDRSMMLPFVPHKEDAFLLVVSALLLVASLARQITKTCAFCRMWCLCLVLFCLVLNWHGLFMIWSAQFCSGCQFGKASAIRIGLQIRIWVCCRSQDGAWELISKSSHHRFRSWVLNKCSSWMNLAFVLVTADSWIGMNHLEVAWCKPSLFGCTFPSVDLYILG